jgi:hypothetical protein
VIRQMATVTIQAMRLRGTGLLSCLVPDDALTPELALAYLGELSTDIRAAVVLSVDGERLAGEEELAEAARDLLTVPSDAPVIEVDTPRGTVVGARGERFALAVVAGRQALPALVRFDVRRTLEDLERA